MPELTPRTPIVVFGDDWGRHPSSMQHLFRHVSEQYTVVWINAIGHRPPTLSVADARRAAQALGRVIRRGRSRQAAAGDAAPDIGSPPREIIGPVVMPWHQFAAARLVNRWSLRRAIGRTLAGLGLTDPPLLVTGTPPSVCVVGHLGETASVYLCMDDFLHLPHVSARMLAPLERRLLERVDATVATARALVESKRPRSGTAYYLPQGVNFAHFATPLRIPPELADLPRPLIGFAGGLTTPVDLPLLARVAAEFPRASLVLVGPVRRDISSLDAPNIHVLQSRPYRALPAYVQAFDVGIIPYVLNAHTVAVDPLKLLEYLAAGVPVVTTDLPEVRKYRDAVRIAENHDAFITVLRHALDEPRAPERHQAVARQHGWESRAAELCRILGEVVAGKPAAP